MKYILAALSLVVSTFAQANFSTDLSAQQKLSVLAALIDSSRVTTDDKNYLVNLFEPQNEVGAKYSINSFDCNYIGRSLRFECQMRLGLNSNGEITDIILIEILGFINPDALIQYAKFTVLVD